MDPSYEVVVPRDRVPWRRRFSGPFSPQGLKKKSSQDKSSHIISVILKLFESFQQCFYPILYNSTLVLVSIGVMSAL